jgi:hypothetical protein
VAIVAAELLGPDGRPARIAEPNARLKLRVTCSAAVPVEDVTLELLVHRSTDGLVLHDGSIRGDKVGLPRLAPGEKLTLESLCRQA